MSKLKDCSTVVRFEPATFILLVYVPINYAARSIRPVRIFDYLLLVWSRLFKAGLVWSRLFKAGLALTLDQNLTCCFSLCISARLSVQNFREETWFRQDLDKISSKEIAISKFIKKPLENLL